MRLTIDRTALLNALTQISGVVERRNTIPILFNILMQADSFGRLRLCATDLDIEIAVDVEADVDIAGDITGPAGQLFDIVKRADVGCDITMSYDAGTDARLKVRAGRSNYALPVLPARDFPSMEDVRSGTTFSMLRSDLARLIDRTRHAVSDDATRHYINGALLTAVSEDGSNYLRMVSTDGKRLALAEMPAPDGAIGAPPVTVPRKTLNVLRALIDADGSAAEVTVAPAKIMVRAGSARLISKVIEGAFPDYQRVIPTGKGKTTVRMNATDLAKGVDRVSILSSDKSRAMRFDFQADGLQLSARSDDGGQADAEVAADVDGAALTAGFNARYVQDVASIITGAGEMEMIMSDASSPTRVHDRADPGVTYVLMPLRF
jgi:DNA polymerase-3 subunit beta